MKVKRENRDINIQTWKGSSRRDGEIWIFRKAQPK